MNNPQTHAPHSTDCVFCTIATGVLPVPLLAQNEYAVAFADRSPRAPVHILIVPRVHRSAMGAVTAEDALILWGMTELAQKLAVTYGNASDQGYNLIVNSGASAGQSVYHLHWHFMAGRDLYAADTLTI